MTPDIQKILYCSDLSKNAAYAFRYAVFLAQKIGATIAELHVVEKMSPDAQFALMTYLDKTDRKKLLQERIDHAMARMKSRMDAFCEKELGGDRTALENIVSIDVCEGFPAEEILKKSEEWHCDAIVMGAHEKGVTHTFLGSVAKSVLRRSRKPTFIIPLPRGEIDLSVHDG